MRVFNANRPPLEMKKDGFSWCRDGKFYMKLTFDDEASVEDLLRINALSAMHMKDTCVLQTRAYLQPGVFSLVHTSCQKAGFQYETGTGWMKSMGVDEWEELRKIIGEKCTQRSEKVQEAAQDKVAASMDKRATDRAADRRAAEEMDPTYKQRFAEYEKLLRWMSATGNFSQDSDGSPNWPDPPVPGEKGIVARKHSHLAVYPPSPPATSEFSSMYPFEAARKRAKVE